MGSPRSRRTTASFWRLADLHFGAGSGSAPSTPPLALQAPSCVPSATSTFCVSPMTDSHISGSDCPQFRLSETRAGPRSHVIYQHGYLF